MQMNKLSFKYAFCLRLLSFVRIKENIVNNKVVELHLL